MKDRKVSEYDAFHKTIRELLKVSHAEIKSQLDTEEKKKRKTRRFSASREASEKD